MIPKQILLDIQDCKEEIDNLLMNAYLHSADLIELFDQLLEVICAKPFDLAHVSDWLANVRTQYDTPYAVSGRSAVGDYVYGGMMKIAVFIISELERIGLIFSPTPVCYKVDQILNRRFLVISERSNHARVISPGISHHGYPAYSPYHYSIS